ncbi:MAG: ferrous iron transport protein B [Candidatus Hydromicrobium americanum]|nr:MAG: ferrous iron transport protein B [Candidatus Hydromicrobium americanum]
MAKEIKEITIAISGNPNSGKTTIFNNLTGLRQHVGNYPGVTVEKKTGVIKYKGYRINVVDLPGTYSLTAYSLEEIVARNFIVNEKPDVVIDVVDSSNLERNLYLAVQLMELNTPLILAFNMADIVKKSGKKIDINLLSELFGAPIVETVGSRGLGSDKLLEAIVRAVSSRKEKKVEVKYGEEVENEIDRITLVLKKQKIPTFKFDIRWIAVKLLEQDREIIDKIKKGSGSKYLKVEETVGSSIDHLTSILRDSPEVIIADGRYGFIKGALLEAYKEVDSGKLDVSEKIDRVLTNRILGIPIFVLIIWLMFQFVFTLGKYPMGWIELGFEKLSALITEIVQQGLIRSLLVDGIIGGVGGVITFTPNIILLFFTIAVLEDSGYMARAAFVMDRIMHKIGLHGKSFIPLIIGFGCTVPAYMGSRILENRKDRLVTMHINTFMSCGARLPVYILFAGAFFPAIAGNVIFSIYLIGVLMAVTMARVLRATRFRGESEPFVMELPPYRIPTLKGILIHTWERTWMYIKKAGTVILAISILMWILFTFPMIGNNYSQNYNGQIEKFEQSYRSGEITEDELNEKAAVIEGKMAGERLTYSAAGRIGRFLEPVFRPLGFDWKMVVATISGIAAKEVVVSTMGTLYSIQEADGQSDSLKTALYNHYHPLVGYNFMLFTLLYFPCMAGMVIFRKEAGTKEMLFQIGYTFLLAWVMSFLVFQIGRLFI